MHLDDCRGGPSLNREKFPAIQRAATEGRPYNHPSRSRLRFGEAADFFEGVFVLFELLTRFAEFSF